MGARVHLPRITPAAGLQRLAAGAVAALALESVFSAPAGPRLDPRTLPGGLVLPGMPGGTRVTAIVLAAALLALTPAIWRGTRAAVTLALVALAALAALELAGGRDGVAGLQLTLAALLALGRGAFRLGCCRRPRRGMLLATAVAWSLALTALACAPVVGRSARHVARILHHRVVHVVHLAAGTAHLSGDWNVLLEVLIGGALLLSVLAVRSLVLPAAADHRRREHEEQAARALVEAHGTDSLAPFLLNPDKALAFAAGGVLSYRVIGGTAVISADPVAPDENVPEVLAAFREQARRRGWQVVLWGASERHLAAYRRLGLRALRAGEEAFVQPTAFSLEGRAVRKLRQSVHRVRRRGWTISVADGRQVDPALEAEIEALAERWRRDHPRLHGFAMGMGGHHRELRPDDLYLLGRGPDGSLGAVLRFAAYGPNLSLDTMQRVGATPNGLTEALVVRALEVARERGVPEVSLNYAGLAHLIRGRPGGGRLWQALAPPVLALLHRRFQMDRLVRFNEKFSPEWRPRYLVYESPAGLPRAILRVLQAEGYLPRRKRAALRAALAGAGPWLLPAPARQRRALGESR